MRQAAPFLRLEAAEPDAPKTVVAVPRGATLEGFLGHAPGAPALCCAGCARVLARQVDPVRFRGLGLECGACGATGVIP